jgi:hypothetical protein
MHRPVMYTADGSRNYRQRHVYGLLVVIATFPRLQGHECKLDQEENPEQTPSRPLDENGCFPPQPHNLDMHVSGVKWIKL